MKLSEELIWRGFQAKTTITNPAELDEKPRKFYLGVDPSADSMTIGNLAALMMASCFVRHGYTPFLLVGGATGQIGDPKETGERELKSIEEIERNKAAIGAQMRRVIKSDNLTIVDNYDWFSKINYLSFLREIGKNFSMTQLLDRQFIQARIGEGGSGISYAEFSYTLIQGYDFLHLFREYGVDLQLCGADQFGNCTSGIHLIRRLANGKADVWSTPLIIDPVTGRKFGKSEGNAIWLDANKTSVLDFYQFWVGQVDEAVEQFLKLYTTYTKEEIEEIMAKHKENTAERVAQKALAKCVTEVVHGKDAANFVERLSEVLFDNNVDYGFIVDNCSEICKYMPFAELGGTGEISAADALVNGCVCESKGEARRLMKGGGVVLNGEKLLEDRILTEVGLLKKGKNKFVLVK